MENDREIYASRVRTDHHIHWLAVVLVAVWAGTIYGWLVGLGAFIALLVGISLTNTLLLATLGSLRATRFSRWGWVLLAVLAIVFTSAEVGNVKP